VLNLINTILTGIALFTLIQRHRKKWEWENSPRPKFHQLAYNWDFTDETRKWEKSYFSYSLMFEFFIIIIHPITVLDFPIKVSAYIDSNGKKNNYVTFNDVYYLSDFLLAFMFLWILILIRNIFNYSIYSDVYAKWICERYGFTAGMRFCLKCYIVKFPILTVMVILTTAILILAYLIRIAENPFYRSLFDKSNPEDDGDYWFDPILNCIYYTVITMTSVGYGDMTPLTTFGKLIAIFDAILGGFVITLTSITLSRILNFNIQQKKAFHNLIFTWKAAWCIVAAFRLNKIKKDVNWCIDEFKRK